MSRADVWSVMKRFGAGELTAEQAAAEVAPAYRFAVAEYDARAAAGGEAANPDGAADPDAWTQVALARQMRVITPDQYQELGEALR